MKKVAHTHGFEHELSGLKSKHLTTRPRTSELCDLRAETRELSPGKKAPALSQTLAYRKSKYQKYRIFLLNIFDIYFFDENQNLISKVNHFLLQSFSK